ncbi:MAG: S8 family serine peptidase, partial [Planctomycetes bacterium]|nr:S8 family serine peptidase [Planctomycetota bacterium]
MIVATESPISPATCSGGGYSVNCGTSMAAPTVTGLCAFILEDYRAQFPAQPDPRNSTLKALLAHNAKD